MAGLGDFSQARQRAWAHDDVVVILSTVYVKRDYFFGNDCGVWSRATRVSLDDGNYRRRIVCWSQRDSHFGNPVLGKFWSLHIEIREQHQFVRSGIYGSIRHPAYLSFVLEHIAVPLAGNAWWALAVTVVVYVPVLLWRWHTEELALCAKFGESYRAYQREVGAWWPRGWTGRRPAKIVHWL